MTERHAYFADSSQSSLHIDREIAHCSFSFNGPNVRTLVGLVPIVIKPFEGFDFIDVLLEKNHSDNYKSGFLSWISASTRRSFIPLNRMFCVQARPRLTCRHVDLSKQEFYRCIVISRCCIRIFILNYLAPFLSVFFFLYFNCYISICRLFKQKDFINRFSRLI